MGLFTDIGEFIVVGSRSTVARTRKVITSAGGKVSKYPRPKDSTPYIISPRNHWTSASQSNAVTTIRGFNATRISNNEQPIPVVPPSWVDDCVQENKILDVKLYEHGSDPPDAAVAPFEFKAPSVQRGKPKELATLVHDSCYLKGESRVVKDENDEPLDALLELENDQGGHFIRLQVLRINTPANDDCAHYFFHLWGKLGTSGTWKLLGPLPEINAVAELSREYYLAVGRSWERRDDEGATVSWKRPLFVRKQ